MTWRPSDTIIATDACLLGLGGVCDGEYFHCTIPDFIIQRPEVHINELECLAVVIALKIWAPRLSRLNIWMNCDNEDTVTVINAGKAKNLFTQACLREIMLITGLASCRIKMRHISGVSNRIPDYLSR